MLSAPWDLIILPDVTLWQGPSECPLGVPCLISTLNSPGTQLTWSLSVPDQLDTALGLVVTAWGQHNHSLGQCLLSLGPKDPALSYPAVWVDLITIHQAGIPLFRCHNYQCCWQLQHHYHMQHQLHRLRLGQKYDKGFIHKSKTLKINPKCG